MMRRIGAVADGHLAGRSFASETKQAQVVVSARRRQSDHDEGKDSPR